MTKLFAYVPMNTRRSYNIKALVTWTKFTEVNFKIGFINGYICKPKFIFVT